MNLLKQKSVGDLIESTVVVAMRSGNADLSMRELQNLIDQRYQRWYDLSTISGRVNELISAKRLHRRQDKRRCLVTGAGVRPLYVTPEQMRIDAS